MDPKIDILSQVDTRVLAIVGVSKLFLIFFYPTFSKLFDDIFFTPTFFFSTNEEY